MLSEIVKVVDGRGGGVAEDLECCPENFLVCRKKFSVCKEIHEKFPKSTRIRIVINTDELYNSSKFLHGAVPYNCKSK
jgi:hypothetical protein